MLINIGLGTWALIGWLIPALDGLPATGQQIELENPSTVGLALTGAAICGLYLIAQRRGQHGRTGERRRESLPESKTGRDKPKRRRAA